MKQIFINLPVADLERSMYFYAQLGFTNNPLFTDEDQKCMVWSDQIYVMLMSKDLFRSFNKKLIPDIKTHITSTFTLPAESLEKVNEMVESGLQAGGVEPLPMLDEGFMQVRYIEDLDGHNWGVIYLDINKFKELKAKK